MTNKGLLFVSLFVLWVCLALPMWAVIATQPEVVQRETFREHLTLYWALFLGVIAWAFVGPVTFYLAAHQAHEEVA